VLGAAAALVVGCAGVGLWLTRHGARLHLGSTYPLAGRWLWHLSLWAAPALVVGVIIVWRAPGAAIRLLWRALLPVSFLVAFAWALSVAVVGGYRDLGRPIATVPEYLHDVPRIREMGLGSFLREFTPHIVAAAPTWTTHVAGHGPLATLLFVWLADLGVRAPAMVGLVCVAAGASAAPSVLSTVRVLAGERVARRGAPFVVAAPLSLWVATSADAVFAGLAAAGLCAMAHACAASRRTASAALGLAGSVLLGACLFMSYGLVLFGCLVLVVVVMAGRRALPCLVFTVVGLTSVVMAFGWAGFDWFAGFAATRERVMIGGAWQDRPAAYFLFADLAVLAISVGPAIVAVVPPFVIGAIRRQIPWRYAAVPLAALAAVGLAIVSNLAKGEVERIFLPFTVWLLPLAALVPARSARPWLIAQVAWTLLIALTTELTW
jgi:methylthioxylose transferase